MCLENGQICHINMNSICIKKKFRTLDPHPLTVYDNVLKTAFFLDGFPKLQCIHEYVFTVRGLVQNPGK